MPSGEKQKGKPLDAGKRAKMQRERLLEVERLMAARVSTASIEHKLSGEWGVTERQVRTYMRIVRERWSAEARILDDNRVGKRDAMRATLELGHARAHAIGDLRSAARYADMLVRLDGLAEPPNVNVNLGVDGLAGIMRSAQERLDREERGESDDED